MIIIIAPKQHNILFTYLCRKVTVVFKVYNMESNHKTSKTSFSETDSDMDGKEITLSESKPFVCELCYKVFSKIEHLQDHTKQRTREKPLECDQCGKRFY